MLTRSISIALLAFTLSGCAPLFGSSGPSPTRSASYVSHSARAAGFGVPVYREEECIGAVVNGVCHGAILPDAGPREKCYGAVLFGECTGPMF